MLAWVEKISPRKNQLGLSTAFAIVGQEKDKKKITFKYTDFILAIPWNRHKKCQHTTLKFRKYHSIQDITEFQLQRKCN